MWHAVTSRNQRPPAVRAHRAPRSRSGRARSMHCSDRRIRSSRSCTAPPVGSERSGRNRRSPSISRARSVKSSGEAFMSVLRLFLGPAGSPTAQQHSGQSLRSTLQQLHALQRCIWNRQRARLAFFWSVSLSVSSVDTLLCRFRTCFVCVLSSYVCPQL